MSDFVFPSGQSLDSGLYDLGVSLMRSKRYSDAIVVLQASVKVHVHYKALELLGECLIEAGRACEAIVPLAASVTLSKVPRPAFLLGRAYWTLRRFGDAAKYVELAVDRSPSRYSEAEALLLEINASIAADDD